MPDDETPEKSVLEVLRRFMTEYVSHHKGLFAMVQVLHALTVLLMLAPPLLIRYIFDTALENEDYTMLAVCSGGIVVTFALWTLVVVAKNYWGHDIAQRTTSWLRNDLYQHLQSLSMSFHDEKKSGELLSRLVDDLNVVQEASYHIPEAVVEATVLITGASVLMFYLNWKLALASLVMMPFLVVFSRYVSVRMWRGFRRVRSQKAKLADELEENLGGIQIIKAFCGEPREAEEVERQNRAHYNTRMDVIKWVSLLYPGAMFLNNTALAIAIFYGGVLVIEGEVLVGTIFAFLFLLQRFLPQLLRIIRMVETVGRFFASLERFFHFIDLEPDIQENPDAHPVDDVEGHIRFENVDFSYGEDEQVLHDVNLEAHPGQMVALVGPSGSGKTTILRLILRLYEPQSGHVLLDDTPVHEIELHDLRKHIGMVMQNDHLFSGSVGDNIAYGKPDATGEEVREAARQANASPVIEKMPNGYDTDIGKRGVKLSEGQRQRISIARALLKNPPILLLDEATSSLDSKTEALIQQAIDNLREGRTTFSIAHRLSTIIGADTILFVEGGRIIERGTHQELLDLDGQYAHFYRVQFGDTGPE